MTKELWEKPLSFFIKGGGHYKKKRLTKTRLVQKYYEKGGQVVPKINTEVREGADDVTEGVAYQINNVEEIVTDVKSFSGIRVTLLSAKAEEGNVVLWQRAVTGTGSKLGVFLTLLGNNTDTWLGKWIKFIRWQPRDRVMELIDAPSPKATKAKKK